MDRDDFLSTLYADFDIICSDDVGNDMSYSSKLWGSLGEAKLVKGIQEVAGYYRCENYVNSWGKPDELSVMVVLNKKRDIIGVALYRHLVVSDLVTLCQTYGERINLFWDVPVVKLFSINVAKSYIAGVRLADLMLYELLGGCLRCLYFNCKDKVCWKHGDCSVFRQASKFHEEGVSIVMYEGFSNVDDACTKLCDDTYSDILNKYFPRSVISVTGYYENAIQRPTIRYTLYNEDLRRFL